jgi:hypothetical protein
MKRRLKERWMAVDKDGLAIPGLVIRPGDYYLNKAIPKNTSDTVRTLEQIPDAAYKPDPHAFRGPNPVIVDKVSFSFFSWLRFGGDFLYDNVWMICLGYVIRW